MRAAPGLVAFIAALTVLAAPSARAADECRGLPVCIPVAGPWSPSRRATPACGSHNESVAHEVP